MWPTSQAAIPKGNRGPGGYTVSSIFFQMIDQDTWEPGPPDSGGCWLDRVSGRRHQWMRASEVSLITWGCRALLSVMWSLCSCLGCIAQSWYTLAEEPQHHPALSSIMGISLPLPIWPEVRLYQDKMEDFTCFQVELPSTNMWQNSFLPCATVSLSLRGTLRHPQPKAPRIGVVWVSKFPSLFSIAATQMFTLWRPSWSFTFESCQSLSSPSPNMKTFFLVDNYSQKMKERSVILLICLLLPQRLFPPLNVAQLSSYHSLDLIEINEVPGNLPLNFLEAMNWMFI